MISTTMKTGTEELEEKGGKDEKGIFFKKEEASCLMCPYPLPRRVADCVHCKSNPVEFLKNSTEHKEELETGKVGEKRGLCSHHCHCTCGGSCFIHALQ